MYPAWQSPRVFLQKSDLDQTLCSKQKPAGRTLFSAGGLLSPPISLYATARMAQTKKQDKRRAHLSFAPKAAQHRAVS